MKNLMTLWAITGMSFFAFHGAAQNSADSVAAGSPAATQPAPTSDQVQLPQGASEILKLSRSQVADDTIIAYIAKSSTTYNLTAQEIIYLKDQGVSSPVLTAMLQQQQRVAQPAINDTQQSQAPTVAAAAPAPEVNNPQPAPTFAPSPAPASTTYTVQAPATTYYYPSYYYPYSYPYYGYAYPGIALSFGFGNYWGYHGYHGGYYYGGYHGHYAGGGHGGHH